MLKIIQPWALRSFRSISTQPVLPFADDLKGDDQYNEFNEFYSDLFTETPSPVTHQRDGPPPQDEISEINAELTELYGLNDTEQPSVLHQPRSLLSQLQDNSPKVIISPHTNPFINLAFEEYIFQNMPKLLPFNAQRLLFYTNSPCVVVGKNQNPWKECNIPLIQSLQIPLVRRRSGGGTVVHDLKNVNYSYMTTREAFSRAFFGNVIVKELNDRQLGLPLKLNERHDIITADSGKKVSGSAYKISKGKSYHHGTMLLNSKLDVLRSLLNTKDREGVVEFRCNSVPSVPAPVTNIEVDNEDFIDAVSEGFIDTYEDCELIELDEIPEEVQTIAHELEQWDWKFGTTPKFEMDVQHKDFKISFSVEKGRLTDFSVDSKESEFQFLRQVLDSGECIPFKGSSIAGFIVDDEYSEFVGKYIDGTD